MSAAAEAASLVETPADLSPGRTRKLSRKRVVILAIAVAAMIGAGNYGHYWWTTGRFLESTDDAYVGGDVTVIAPKIAGFVDRLAVEDNQRVHAGDLLVHIDDRDFKAALARADATLAGQIAALANLEAGRELQEAVVAQAQAEIAAAEAERARTRFDFDRYRELSANKYASEQRFQQADADYKKAVAALLRANAALDASKRQLGVIDTQKAQVRAAIDQARADRSIARLNLSYTEIRAPIDGIVGNRSVRIGSYATVGSGLMALVPSQGLWVDANFKESQLAQMRSGQRASLSADVLPGVRFTGHIGSLAPATGAQFSVLPPENATGNFTKIVQRVPVRIVLDGDAGALGRLRPGLSVTVAVDLRGQGDLTDSHRPGSARDAVPVAAR